MGRSVKGRKTNSPRDGEGFIYHTLDLMASPAWRGRSIACARLIDFLELEHARHGGKENGRRLAPYTQLVEFGIGRRFIADAIREAEQRGLIRVECGGKKGTAITGVNRFTLTYYWTKHLKNGLWDWKEKTDDWRAVKESTKIGAHQRELAPSPPLEIARPAVVHQSEPPSIFWVASTPPPQQRGRRLASKSAAASPREPEAKPSGVAHLLETKLMERSASMGQRKPA